MTEDQKYYLKIFLGVIVLFTVLTLIKSRMCKSNEGFADEGKEAEPIVVIPKEAEPIVVIPKEAEPVEIIAKKVIPENPLLTMKKIHDGLSSLKNKMEAEKELLHIEMNRMTTVKKEIEDLKSKKMKFPTEIEKLLIKDFEAGKITGPEADAILKRIEAGEANIANLNIGESIQGPEASVEVKNILSESATLKNLTVEGEINFPKGFMSKLSANAAASADNSDDGASRNTFDEIVLRKKNMRLSTSKSKKGHVRRGKTFDETIDNPEKCFDRCRKTSVKVGKKHRKANACTHSDEGECKCAFMRRFRPDKFFKKKGHTSFVAI